MNRFSSIPLFVAALAFVPAHAAVARPQEQDVDTRLRAGEIRVTVDGPTTASIAATFELTGESAAALLLAAVPGQTVEGMEIRLDGELLPAVAESRSSALHGYALRAPVRGRLDVRYRLVGGDAARFRFVLPVPEATPGGDTEAVRLVVTLPAGAEFAGNVFPPMQVGQTGLETNLAAVPAVLHVVFGAAGAELYRHRILEVEALVVAALLLLGGWWWHLRRGRAAEAAP